jgi:cytochrome c peroxidase
MKFPSRKWQALGMALFLVALSSIMVVISMHPWDAQAEDDFASHLDRTLIRVLRDAGFTGNVEATLEARLGRRIDPELADLGRLLFFDKILGLHGDNSCSGCHSPAFGFGDSQPMAIGVDNNDIVGPNRRGPRNQRRSPLVPNTIFYPALMWTPRFVPSRSSIRWT